MIVYVFFVGIGFIGFFFIGFFFIDFFVIGFIGNFFVFIDGIFFVCELEDKVVCELLNFIEKN